MFLGRVVGTVWSSVKWPQLGGMRLLLVKPYDRAALDEGIRDAAAAHDDSVVCADVLGAGAGEDVVVAYGHAARVAISETPSPHPTVPIDAAVVAIVDRFTIE